MALDTFKLSPSGVQARRVVMAFTALVAFGAGGADAHHVAWLSGQNQRGTAESIRHCVLALFLALFWTREERRLTLHGFWVSIVGVGVYAMQAYDVWPVFPSDAYYALMALILLAEGAVI